MTTPTREDLVQLLTKEPQIGLTALAALYLADAVDILKALQASSDFERCAPRPEDGSGFAWRLSSLAVDPRVRAAAIKHQRTIEQPPQMRAFHNGAPRSSLPLAGDGARNVLVQWLQANPGEWLVTQIATARGISIAAVRDHIRKHPDLITKRRPQGKSHLLVSLRT